MLIEKYNIDIDTDAIKYNLTRITNQIYKLLPSREEGLDWKKPLETLLEELAGMSILLSGQHKFLFSLLCKMEGLNLLTEERDFSVYRKTIFECLSLMNDIKNDIE